MNHADLKKTLITPLFVVRHDRRLENANLPYAAWYLEGCFGRSPAHAHSPCRVQPSCDYLHHSASNTENLRVTLRQPDLATIRAPSRRYHRPHDSLNP